MIEPRAGWVVVWIGAGLLVAARVDGAARAVPVSPGAPTSAASSTVAGGCPTFSWSPAGSATASELAVLALGAEGDLESAQVVLRWQVPAGASSWTPGGSDRLAPEREYAWLVRAVDIDQRTGSEWSPPLYFRVASAPSAEEVAAALALLERWRASQGFDADGIDDDSGGDITGVTAGVTAGSGLSGGGASGNVTVAANFAGSGSASIPPPNQNSVCGREPQFGQVSRNAIRRSLERYASIVGAATPRREPKAELPPAQTGSIGRSATFAAASAGKDSVARACSEVP